MKHDSDINIYNDIIKLPHHVSKRRAQMSVADRAAQFSPFAAVVGHEKAVKEAARITDQRKELDEMEKAIIDEQLREIEVQLPSAVDVEIQYFIPDEKKDGGEYRSKVGHIKKIDTYLKDVLMTDGMRIAIKDIYQIIIN